MDSTVSTSSHSQLAVPPWFQQGHLRDDIAREMQTHSGYTNFISTMKKPEQGMRAETSIRTTDGKWFRMSGSLVWVGELPTLEDVERTGSLFMTMANSENANTSGLTPQEKHDFIHKFLGSVHGQQMKSVSRLTEMHPPGFLPIQNHDVVELTYRFYDTMFFPWVVEGIRVLQAEEIDSLPPLFYTYFEGCSCPRCKSRTRDTKPAAS